MSDGTIWLDTKVDTRGFEKGVDRMEAKSKEGSASVLNSTMSAVEKTKQAWLEAIGGGDEDKQNRAFAAFKAAEAAAKGLGAVGKEGAKATAVTAAGAEEAAVGLSLMGTEGATAGSAIASAAAAAAKVLGIVALTGLAVAAVIAVVVVAIAALVATLIGAGIAMYKALEGVVNRLYATMDRSQAVAKEMGNIKVLFDSVKQASSAAFLPLITFALPYIQAVTNALIQMFNFLGRLLASVLGLNKAWQYVAGSTKLAEQGAKGSLAAFDQINVLQQGGPGINAGAGSFVAVDVDPAMLEKEWAKFKDWWEENVAYPINKGIFDFTADTVRRFWALVDEATAAFVGWQADMKTQFDDWAANVKPRIDKALASIADRAAEIRMKVDEAWAGIKAWWKEHVTDPIAAAFNDIKEKAGLLVGKLIIAWLALPKRVEEEVVKPLKNAFINGLNKVGAGFAALANTAGRLIVSLVNNVIRAINSMIAAAVTGINTLISLANNVGSALGLPTIPKIGGVSIPLVTNFAPVAFAPIPNLASGAVIPPNSRFAAILGDQTGGRNLEAPEELIRQIVREEGGSRAVTIKFAGSLAELVRVLRPYTDREDVRIGPSLISSGAAT